MRTSLLFPLLLLLLHSTLPIEGVPLEEAINWNECGETAVCRVHKICNEPRIDKAKEAAERALDRFIISERKCDFGIHIKPETTKKWTVSIVASTATRSQATPTLTLSVGKGNLKEVFKCEGNKATRGKDFTDSEITIRDVPQSRSERTFCVFTIETNSANKLSAIIDRDKDRKAILQAKDGLRFNIDFEDDVDGSLICNKESLFTEQCDETEECKLPTIVKPLECPSGFTKMFRKDTTGNFTETNVECSAGQFKWGTPAENDIVLGQSQAKCMRKKCTLCSGKKLEPMFQAADGAQNPCARLNCSDPSKPFMVFSMTSNGQTMLRSTYEPLQCSGNSSETASYWMYGDDRVQIESAECKESISCDNEGGQSIATRCKPEEKKEHQCITARRTETGTYICDKEGFSLRAVFNETAVAIEPPTCESDGTWQFNVTDNTTSIPVYNNKEELVVNCYLDKVPKTGEKVSEAGGHGWIIAIVVLLIIIVVAIAIAVFCFLKRRKAAKKAGPSSSVPSKTSSTSKNSKPSSSDQEPLTSAMVSITGDSVQTAKAKSVVFAKAALPVPSSETSTKRTTKKESKKKAAEKDERIEKTCEQGDSDSARKARIDATIKKGQEKEYSFYESSNNQEKDLTSTKDTTKATPVRATGSGEDRTLLQSQTGGDGESKSQVEKINGEKAKLIPNAPRKYSTTKKSTKEANPNNKFLNITDSSEDEQSKTGSKKRRVNKRK